MSWSRRGGAMVVVMNRDERHDRAPARPPRRWPGAGGGFLAPVDGAAGGTWIAARQDGVVLALLNHHAGPSPAHDRPRVSRGHLVATLAASPAPPDAAALRACGLAAFAPFRLLVIGRRRAPVVFTWNGRRLRASRPGARVGFLTSSSWNSLSVIASRQARFRRLLRDHPSPTAADLIALHAESTDPRGTPWAICMARGDARTVSQTVVNVRPDGSAMTYRARARSRQPASAPGRRAATSVRAQSSPVQRRGSASAVARA